MTPLLRGGIGPLLFPASVAVVGASDRTPEGAADLEQVVRGGVPTWFVNPNRPTVLGRECFPALTALPETPECAFLLVGHTRAEAAFEDAIAAGVRAVVMPGLGAEAGAEGREVTARIAARAAECDIAVVGPNCMGVATPGGVSLWLGTVAGPEEFAPGHVACVAHSGSIAEACLSTGPRVGFRTVVSAGGELSRDLADFVAFLAARRGHARDRAVRRDDPAPRGLRRGARARGRGGQAGRVPQGRALAGGGAGGARALGRRGRLVARLLGPAAPPRGARGERLPRVPRDARGARAEALAARAAHRGRVGVGRRMRPARRPRRGRGHSVRTVRRGAQGPADRSVPELHAAREPARLLGDRRLHRRLPREPRAAARHRRLRRPARAGRPLAAPRRARRGVVLPDRRVARRRHRRHGHRPRRDLGALDRPAGCDRRDGARARRGAAARHARGPARDRRGCALARTPRAARRTTWRAAVARRAAARPARCPSTTPARCSSATA